MLRLLLIHFCTNKWLLFHPDRAAEVLVTRGGWGSFVFRRHPQARVKDRAQGTWPARHGGRKERGLQAGTGSTLKHGFWRWRPAPRVLCVLAVSSSGERAAVSGAQGPSSPVECKLKQRQNVHYVSGSKQSFPLKDIYTNAEINKAGGGVGGISRDPAGRFAIPTPPTSVWTDRGEVVG